MNDQYEWIVIDGDTGKVESRHGRNRLVAIQAARDLNTKHYTSRYYVAHNTVNF